MPIVGKFKFQLDNRSLQVVFGQVVITLDLIRSELGRVDVDPVDDLIQLGTHHRLMVVVFVVLNDRLFAVVLERMSHGRGRGRGYFNQTGHFTRTLQPIVLVGKQIELDLQLGHLLVDASMIVVNTLERLVKVVAKVNVGRRLVVRQAQKVTLVHAQVNAVQPVFYLFKRRVIAHSVGRRCRREVVANE
jgi:hypothetical protein